MAREDWKKLMLEIDAVADDPVEVHSAAALLRSSTTPKPRPQSRGSLEINDLISEKQSETDGQLNASPANVIDPSEPAENTGMLLDIAMESLESLQSVLEITTPARPAKKLPKNPVESVAAPTEQAAQTPQENSESVANETAPAPTEVQQPATENKTEETSTSEMIEVPALTQEIVTQSVDLAQALQTAGVIEASVATNVRAIVSKTPGKSIADVLVEQGVDEVRVQEALAISAGMKFERIDPDKIEVRFLERLGTEFCKSNNVIPLRMMGPRLLLGVIHPDNLMIIDEVRHKLNLSVKTVVVCRRDIATAVEAHSARNSEDNAAAVDEIIAGIDVTDIEVVQHKEEDVNLEKIAGESPVIRLVNYLVFNAVKEGASDIHIEPQEKKLRIRYRVDGVLFEMMNPPQHMHAAVISRLKIMANLDISERRLPQDGRIRANIHGRKLDLRLSTLPTALGEKAVLRILDTRSIQVSLDALGMYGDQLTIWKNQIDQPHGIILVTGPTGSGKTTTLYASLAQMDTNELNISTVEDPVEYHLNGISQVQVHERIGMSFAAALRSLLRQDPDVMMVGEVRDAETAKIAIQASLTGHLVLSTLHTNDAPGSITRLINIGVEPYLIGSAVNAVLSQRLVRKLCQHCKKQEAPSGIIADHLAMHGIPAEQVWRSVGCDKCRNTGYSGRIGIFEMLVLDDMLRDRITSNPSVTEFRRICVERGMVTLREDGFRKVAQGYTTVEEVLRVTEATI